MLGDCIVRGTEVFNDSCPKKWAYHYEDVPPKQLEAEAVSLLSALHRRPSLFGKDAPGEATRLGDDEALGKESNIVELRSEHEDLEQEKAALGKRISSNSVRNAADAAIGDAESVAAGAEAGMNGAVAVAGDIGTGKAELLTLEANCWRKDHALVGRRVRRQVLDDKGNVNEVVEGRVIGWLMASQSDIGAPLYRVEYQSGELLGEVEVGMRRCRRHSETVSPLTARSLSPTRHAGSRLRGSPRIAGW